MLRGWRRQTAWPLAVLLASSLLAACSPLYVIRAGIAESRILSRRRPIAAVLSDPDTPAADRAKLRLVVEARDFANHFLDLDVGESYTTYSWVESDTLLLVVSAARKDRFQAHTWWFPIVGSVPYKGFFDFDAAHREAAALERRGLDAYVRPSPAFSTLGFFNDPLLNTSLRADDVGLVATVIHELLHNTLYIPSQIAFNESLASFVGDRGAAEFFCAREGEAAERCIRARHDWEDNIVFGSFLSGLVDDLEELYARTDVDSAAKVAMREPIFQRARATFDSVVQPRLHRSFGGYFNRPLNNATLIGTRLYYRRLDLFEAAWRRCGEDLVTTLNAIRRALVGHESDPYGAVEALVADSADCRP